MKRSPEDFEGEISVLQGQIRRLAKDLISIAELSMPDTYFASDSRVKYAKSMLTRYKKGK